MWRKLRVALAAAAVAGTVLAAAGCGSTQKPAGTSTGGESGASQSQTQAGSQGQSGKPLRVAYVISGNLGDKSFFDSGMAGLERAKKDFGIEVKVIQSEAAADWEPNLKAAAEGGYDLIIAGASQMREPILNVAPQYPNLKFAYLDDVVDLPNVASVDYAEEQGSFVVGALAAMMTTRDLPGMNKEKIIGWVGGMDIAVLRNFLEGYKQGAKYVDPEVKVLDSFAGSFNDPAKGKELTLAQYSQGADIVFNVAGATGQGIIAAAKEAGKYAIGVDVDQDNEAPGHVLTSMLKRVDNSTYDMVKLVVENKWKGGTYKYGLAQKGVGITDMSVMGDKIPQDVRAKLNEIIDKIAKGEITVKEYGK